MIRVRRGLVITGGEAPGKKWFSILRKHFHYLVAADSGLQRAHDLGLRVDAVVGDMDSLENKNLLEEYPADAVIRHPEDKDYTDTELGLQLLRERGCTFTGIFGGGGGRLDHLAALLSLFDRHDSPDIWVQDSGVVLAVNSKTALANSRNLTVSFFPVGTETCKMVSTGLKWPLNTLTWKKGDVGVSNVIVSDEMTVEMKSGRLVLIGPLEILEGITW